MHTFHGRVILGITFFYRPGSRCQLWHCKLQHGSKKFYVEQIRGHVTLIERFFIQPSVLVRSIFFPVEKKPGLKNSRRSRNFKLIISCCPCPVLTPPILVHTTAGPHHCVSTPLRIQTSAGPYHCISTPLNTHTSAGPYHCVSTPLCMQTTAGPCHILSIQLHVHTSAYPCHF